MARLARGDRVEYVAACRHLLGHFGTEGPAPKTANNVAWSWPLGPAALADYAPAVRLAELLVATALMGQAVAAALYPLIGPTSRLELLPQVPSPHSRSR